MPKSNPIYRQLESALKVQRAAYLDHPYPSYSERKADLRTLQRFVRDHKEAIIEAINSDFGNRSRHETLFAEIFPILDAVEHTLKRLKRWMEPQKRGVDLRNFMGAKNRVIPQPLGVIGVIVPWNFPLNLTLIPLIYILAAGNRAMIKLSENSRNLSNLLKEELPSYFPPEKVAIFEETGNVGIEFSKLPFDHLLFTGSTQTGRAVMSAASQNLCPVTLELGGKSPALVCKDFSIRKAAERVLFVKLFNAGQICTTVDYLWLPYDKIERFIELAKKIIPQRYPSIDSVDYTSIIDDRAFNRLTSALEKTEELGTKTIQLIPGERWNAETRKIAPHIVLDPPDTCEFVTREIFGPILPIHGYHDIEEVIEHINSHPRPLAFYPFSNDTALIEKLLNRVMSGGVSVNDGLMHVAQHELPFGGVGESGMGHYHGYEGFVTFSKMRPVFYQASISSLKLLHPPYGKFATNVLNFLTK
ncbi:MAG TPA: coniferyl aldehyde dehydrogenase [Rhodocyclaceae bacterium]|nr:coniferyl aldehyde dehydrogenase [Rhodocyclaceae bacterium]